MHLTKSKWFVFLSISVVLLWALTACGGQTETDPSPAEEIAQQEVVEAENTPTPTVPPPTSTPVPPTPTPLPPTPTPVPTDTPPADSTLEENTADTTMLPDLPLPEDAQGVTYEFSEIIFTSPTEIEALVEFYREALSPDNWEEQVDFSQVDDTFAFVEFDRGDEFIFITIVDFDGAREASIDLSGAPSLAGSAGDGDSTTAATDGSGYTIADWPVPPEAQDVDISGDILSFKVSLQLADVAEFYRPTYEMMDLGTGCLDDAADYTSLSCSVSTGDVTLHFFAFEGADDTEVEIDFVNYALDSSTGSSGDSSGELGAIDEDGLPLPDDYTGYASEGSEFSRRVYVSSPSDLDTLLEFFQTELSDRGWTLDDSDQSSAEATLRYSGPDGELLVTLQSGGETEVALTFKNPSAAKEAGILPPAGQARIYLINFSEDELSVTINDQVFELAAEAGMESPDDATKLDLPPGTYEVTTEVGSSTVTDEVTIGPDEAWGLLLDEQGALPTQIY
jgi:hypothetical protein